MSSKRHVTRNTIKNKTVYEVPALDIKPDKESLIQFPFVELNELKCPLSTATIPNMNKNCTDACEKSFLEIKTELANLKRSVNEQKKLLKKLVGSQHAFSLSDIDTVNPLLPFPLDSDDALKTIEKHINEENRDQYIKKIRDIIHGNIGKNLRYILTDEIVLNYNMDGVFGKKRLKDYDEFYEILLEALNSPEENDPPDLALRKALQIQKKRFFRRKSAMKSKKKGMKSEDDDVSDTNSF